MTAAAFQAAAVCLEYPDETLPEVLPLLRAVGTLGPFVEHVARTPLTQLQADYVATFDLRRRCCPFLSYYLHGDTRNRGVALLEFTAAYRAAGFALSSAELPDHLAVVCEFAARCPGEGVELLQRNRVGLELLRLGLADAGSPWVSVVDAIRGLLPAASARDLERARELVRVGPPAETVGIG